jgi:hypothetical protein
MAQITLSWSDFKASVDRHKLNIFYIETSTHYYLFGYTLPDGKTELLSTVSKDSGSDQTDFETNYKAKSPRI